MEKPLVSIIMPTYNRENIIKRAINSICNQSYTHWELIIVDDKSTDYTKNLISEICKKEKRIKFVTNAKHTGVAGARNTGMALATGKYLAFLDSDDEWMDNHLEESISVLEKEDVDICFSLWVEKNGDKLHQCNKDEFFIKNYNKALKPESVNILS